MAWSVSALRIFFLVFGVAETVTNLIYLVKLNGLALARKQHRELPRHATPTQIQRKVVCMFLSGLLFITVALVSFFTQTYTALYFSLAAGTFLLYILIEAIAYRYWRLFGASAFAAALFICTLLA